VDAGGLALASPQVVELGAPDRALPVDLDAVDDRRVEREDALDPDPPEIFRTVNVSRAPPLRRAMTTPANIWMRSFSPSRTLTWTRTLSPERTTVCRS
jgi:hypothetical protein